MNIEIKKPKFFDIGQNSIYLILGQSCNLQCKYCLKHTMVNEQLTAEFSYAVRDYLEYLIETRTLPVNLMYYGGEPLLYFNTIKQIKEFCDEKEKEHKKSVVHHGMISNGKALTQEIIDWIIENKISYTVSYDGYNSDITRGFDAIKEKEDLLLQIPDLCLSAVVTSANYPLDILKAFQEFDDKYFVKNGRHIGINLDELMDTGCGIETQELLKIDQERYNNDIKEILESYLATKAEDKRKEEYSLKESWGWEIFIRMISAKENQDNLKLSKCGQTLRVLNIDLKGNIYSCHNSTEENLGHIIDPANSIIEKFMASEYKIMNRRRTICKDCPAEYICQCGCKLISDERMETTCRLKKGVISAIKETLVKMMNKL